MDLNQRVGEFADETKRTMETYPLNSVTVAFGLGLSLGLLTTMLLAGRKEPQRDSLTAQIRDSVARIVPEYLSTHRS